MSKADKVEYVPQSGRGPIGWCWLGYAPRIGFTKEQLKEMPILCAKRAALSEQ